MELLNVGVVGCGRIGSTHIRNLKQLRQFRIVATYDPFLVESEFKHYQSYSHFLQDPDIQAVLICSPSDKHVEHVILAAQAKKYIFCEKPLGLSEPDIQEAISVCRQNNVPLQLGFNRRFDPEFNRLKDQMKSIPDFMPHVVKITSRDPYRPDEAYIAQSGGIFFDMMIHDFDMVRYLCEDEVIAIHAMGACLIDPVFARYDDYDTAMVQLTMAKGTLIVIENCRQTNFGYDQRIEVFNNQACIKADNQKEHHVNFRDKKGLLQANPKPFFLERYSQAYQRQMIAFFRSCTQDEPVTVSGEDGLISFQLAQAAKQSIVSNRVIKLR